MSFRPDIPTTLAMYELYQKGLSCAQVAKVFKVRPATVWDRLRRRNLPRRPKPETLPFIEFEGHRYTVNCHGYFRRTTSPRTWLHWDIWEKANGPVPKGQVIKFVDGDRLNIALDNLECVGRDGVPSCKPLTLKTCLACGQLMGRRVTGTHSEGPKEYAKRKTCGLKCSGVWKRGKKKGTRMPL